MSDKYKNFSMDYFSLKGKVAIITGANQGLGLAYAAAFAKAGADLFIPHFTDDIREVEEIAKAEGRRIEFLQGDLTDKAYIKQIVDVCMEKYGRIDILVNNQGGNGKDVKADLDVVNTPAETFEKQLNFNLTSTYTCCQKVIPNMIENGGGVIVNIASMNGEFADMVRTGYGVSKAGLDKLTQNIAMQYGRANIRCNAVAPGFIRTDAALSLPQQFIDGYVRHLPIKRLGEVEDIANAVLFFASDDSAWVSGQILEVAGGFGCGTPMYADMVER